MVPCMWPTIRPTPEQSASVAELGHLLEKAVLDLPEHYRAVVMLRDIEELSTAETAATLDLTEENVKIRLHRGRAMARQWLFDRSVPRQKKLSRSWVPAATASSQWFSINFSMLDGGPL